MEPSLLNILWLLVCAAFVLLMQAGFTCLEYGMSRQKNCINVAIKNMTDLGLSVFLFWIFGYGLMFGSIHDSWFGTIQNFSPTLNPAEAWQASFFIYQAMFCATAITIISGAIAERVYYWAYLAITIIVSGIIYPLFGQFVWNGANNGVSAGWLGQAGFVDFAGSTVVHSLGGWTALALLLIIGPRFGRFTKDGKPVNIPSGNLAISIVGVLLLWLGWFGFNGGSTFGIDYSVPKILLNTILSGAVGAGAALHIGWIFRGRADVGLLMNGSLAGLVAITANCHAVSTFSAVIIGAIGGVVMYLVTVLLEKAKIDDVVGAIPVHLGAGIWGTIAVAIFGDLNILGTGLDRVTQLMIQLKGVFVCFVLAFLVPYVVFSLLNRIRPLRVTIEDEEMGLNISEHDAHSEFVDLIKVMDEQEHTQNLSLRASEDAFTEVGQIARRYNKLLDALERTVTQTKSIVQNIQDGIFTFTSDGALVSMNPAAQQIFQCEDEEILETKVDKLLAEYSEQLGQNTQDTIKFDEFSLAVDKNYDLTYGKSLVKKYVELRITKAEFSDKFFYTGVIRDVTENKNKEIKIQEEAERLHKFEKVTVNREWQMIQLKDEINGLLEKLGQPKKYKAPYKVLTEKALDQESQ